MTQAASTRAGTLFVAPSPSGEVTNTIATVIHSACKRRDDFLRETVAADAVVMANTHRHTNATHKHYHLT